MTMNSRAPLNHSLLYIALITLALLANACGDAADGPDDFGASDGSGRETLNQNIAGTRTIPQQEKVPYSPTLSAPSASDLRELPKLPPSQRPGQEPAPQDNAPPSEPTATPESSPSPASTAPPTSSNTNSTAFLSKADTRALWVWNENPTAQQLIENSAGAQDELFAFLAAPHNQASRAINRLFFEARGYSNDDRFETVRTADYDPLNSSADRENMRSFLARAHAQGVAVEYLDGQAIWVASDANAQAPKDVCADVVAFNKSSSNVAERFDGIHLDIEPHTVQSGSFAGVWWENRLPGGYNADWTERWKDILNSCRQQIDAYTAETGHRITLSSDLGTDYAHYNGPIREFLNRSDGPLDYLTIMNYFDDRANSEGDPSYFYGESSEGAMVGGVLQNLAAWDQLPLVFAMETGPESIAPDSQSFYQEGYTALYQVTDTLLNDYASPRNIGVGYHHYSPQSYRDLQP